MHYIVNKNNEVLGWASEEDHASGKPPILLQPSWPDFTPWTAEEAEAWGKSWAEFEDGLSDTVPLSGPNAEQRFRNKETQGLILLPNGDFVSEEDFTKLLKINWSPEDSYPEDVSVVKTS